MIMDDEGIVMMFCAVIVLFNVEMENRMAREAMKAYIAAS